MPVCRQALSISQFCELLALNPALLVGIEVNRQAKVITLLLEPEPCPHNWGATTRCGAPGCVHEWCGLCESTRYLPAGVCLMQTSGGIPQLNSGGKRINPRPAPKPKKGGK